MINSPLNLIMAMTAGFGMALLMLMAAGCRSATGSGERLVQEHDDALAAAKTNGPAAVAGGSAAESNALHRFEQFYREYSVEAIRRGVRDVYAPEAYFGDPFRSVRGISAIESYFVKMAEPVEHCSFDITASDRGANGDYYFLWKMELRLKRSPDTTIRALGISHVRFNETGLVVFQQDYWDSSTLFDRLPLVGGMTRFVKGRLEK